MIIINPNRAFRHKDDHEEYIDRFGRTCDEYFSLPHQNQLIHKEISFRSRTLREINKHYRNNYNLETDSFVKLKNLEIRLAITELKDYCVDSLFEKSIIIKLNINL